MPRRPLAVAALIVALAAVAGCSSDGPTVPDAPFSLEPFQDMARNALCAERRNELYLVDERYVLWHREQPGNCVDAGNAIVLYGSTPDDVLCWYAEENFGPLPPPSGCYDASLVELFSIIRANWHVRGYGLEPPHELEPIPF